MIEVGKDYFLNACGGWNSVTVTEVWEQVGQVWAKVSGVIAHTGSVSDLTINASNLLTPEEYKTRMTPKTFTAKYAGKCAKCKGAITPGTDATWLYRADQKVRRNPVIHVTCPN